MRQLVSLTVLVFALGACGTSDNPSGTPDGAAPPNTAPAVSPFVPQAIESAIVSMVGAVAAANVADLAKPPIAVLPKDLTDFGEPVVIGANRMSTVLGCPSIVEAPLVADPNTVSTHEAGVLQNQLIQKYLNQGIYRGLAIAPFTTDEASVGYLNAFVDQRGPAATIDSDSATSKRSYLIATANYQAGYTAGTTLAQALHPGDSIAVFGTTNVNWPSGLERAQGAEDGAAAGGLQIAPRISPNWAADKDLPLLTAALLDPSLNIKGLLCVYSDANLCAQAVEQVVGVPGVVVIVGFDMTADNKAYFDKGYFLGIAVQRQYYMGELGVLVPYAIDVIGAARTNELLQPLLINGTFIDTGIDIITPENYA
jgi:ABC-type sugar transport system substrate-binding protein